MTTSPRRHLQRQDLTRAQVFDITSVTIEIDLQRVDMDVLQPHPPRQPFGQGLPDTAACLAAAGCATSVGDQHQRVNVATIEVTLGDQMIGSAPCRPRHLDQPARHFRQGWDVRLTAYKVMLRSFVAS